MQLRDLSAVLLLGMCVLVPLARADEDTNAPALPLPAEAVRLGEVFNTEAAKIAGFTNLPVIVFRAWQRRQAASGPGGGGAAATAKPKTIAVTIVLIPCQFMNKLSPS